MYIEQAHLLTGGLLLGIIRKKPKMQVSTPMKLQRENTVTTETAKNPIHTDRIKHVNCRE